MKIVCQNCSATYKIADDKVQGKKVFKIKCKKCGEDILVRGTDAPAEAESHMERPNEDEATRVVSNEGSEPIWHAVLNGDQQGPFSIDQLRELMGQGQIDTETYVWRDGFDGWLPMRDVVELAALTTSASAPSPSMPAATGGDLFGAASAAASAEPRSSRGAEPAKARAVPKGGDLFAPEARAEEAAKPAYAEAEKPAPAAGADSLTGQRNENSVLFSLATLQQLSDKNAKPAAPSASDASGLIDINKLAGALNTGPGGGGGKKSSVDDIMSVGASSGMASPLAAPVLAPVAVPSMPAPTVMAEPARPQGINKTILATGVAVAAILVGGGVGAAWLVSRNNSEQQAPAMAANTNPNALPVGAVAAPTAPPSAAPAAPTTPEAAPPPSAAPAPAAGGSEARDRDRDRPRDRDRGSSGSAAAPAAASARVPAPSAPTPSAPAARPSAAGSASIDELLGRVGGGSRPAAAPSGGGSAPAPAAEGAPETPDRGAVRSALSGLSSSVRACGTGTGGTAMVTIVFANTGRVTTATVGGIPPGPAVGCIVGAVRRATLPPFTRSTFSVTYPYPIN